jgi:hypothetical protein
MKDKLDWLWDNIMSIYIDKGVDYKCHIDNLIIISNDNYFECVIDNDYNFKISIEYSFTSEPKIYFETYNYNINNNIDFYIEKLKPTFRNYKINEVI